MMSRGVSALDIVVLVSELQDLLGCYVEKIYQLSRSEILVRVQQKNARQKESLFIRNGALLCRTQKQFDTPEKPSVFAMTLRKYLLNGRITAITQHECDRIITITVGRKEGEYALVCELFSNGNILLLDPDCRIIRPLVTQEWSSRVLKTGELYQPPPSQTNPFILDEQQFIEMIQASAKDVVRTLATTVNLSGLYAEEICARAGVEKTTKTSTLSETQVHQLYQEMHLLLAEFQKHAFHPQLVKKDGVLIDVVPLPFVKYKDLEVEALESLSAGLERLRDAEPVVEPQDTAHQNAVEKLQRQLDSQQQLLEEFSQSSALKKAHGDLLYVHFQACEQLLGQITAVLQEKNKDQGIKEINENPLVSRFDPTANELVVQLPDDTGQVSKVALDFRKSVAENAQLLYEEGKKLQEKFKGAREAVEQTKKDMTVLKAAKRVEKKQPVTHEKQWWFEKFRWFISSEGNIIVAGRDASSNDLVVKKYLTDGDRYAHADIHGAPSCVVKSKGIYDEPLPISVQTLEEACVFAASYSRAWNQFAEAQAYWVLPEQVSKTPQSGEYVPKGAFIIRGKRNYQRCTLEVAVGRIILDDTEKIMGGPVSAVATRATQYAVLVPGATKKSVVARKLAKVFSVSADTLEKVLPPGNLMMTKTIGFTLE